MSTGQRGVEKEKEREGRRDRHSSRKGPVLWSLRVGDGQGRDERARKKWRGKGDMLSTKEGLGWTQEGPKGIERRGEGEGDRWD